MRGELVGRAERVQERRAKDDVGEAEVGRVALVVADAAVAVAGSKLADPGADLGQGLVPRDPIPAALRVALERVIEAIGILVEGAEAQALDAGVAAAEWVVFVGAQGDEALAVELGNEAAVRLADTTKSSDLARHEGDYSEAASAQAAASRRCQIWRSFSSCARRPGVSSTSAATAPRSTGGRISLRRRAPGPASVATETGLAAA